MCLDIFVYKNITLNNYVKKGDQHTNMQIRQCNEC